MPGENGYRVLVKEKIADAGVDLLREHFDVDVRTDMSQEELPGAIADYDAIVIRSATKLTADVIERAERLKVIGRAGIGVDNVDVPAATKRGIIVANAPESNIIAAAEHTIAMMLAQVRNIPQADASLKSGKWERSRFGGVEVYEKTLGILGFGRIGQLVAERAQAFGMTVLAFDPFVARRALPGAGSRARREARRRCTRGADIITIHLPKTPDTINYVNAAAFAEMKDGVRIVNCARGELIDLDALEQALDSGKVGGASLDVFPEEPMTEHPLFGYENVVVTPHLGASTAEAQDRAGVITAEQVVAALRGRAGLERGQHPQGRAARTSRCWSPTCRSAASSGRLAMSLADDHVGRPDRGRLLRAPGRLRHAPADPGRAERRLPGPRRRERQLRERPGDRRGARHPRVASSRRASRATTRTSSRSRSSPTASGSRSRARPSARATCRTWSSRLRAELQHRAGGAPGGVPLLRTCRA